MVCLVPRSGIGPLPPTAVYILAFIPWMGLACLIWLCAAFLFAVPHMRPLARSLSLAMVATFPGVWLFQMVAAPFALGFLLLAHLVWWLVDPGLSQTTENPVVIITSVAAALVSLALVAAMSVMGFYEGWRAGWLRAKGLGWRETVQQGPSARFVHFLRQRMAHIMARSG